MGVRIGLCFLVLLSGSLAYADARSLVISDGSVTQMNFKGHETKFQVSEVVAKKDVLCEQCEELASLALSYLSENKTQTEIIDTLHVACSRFHSLTPQCILLVDNYAPLLFSEITLVQPKDFCRKVNLCKQIAITSLPQYSDGCALCQYAVTEVLVKLKDPDVQLEIIDTLLKGCSVVDNYVKKCKELVFDYVPLFLETAEEYLETNDLCSTFHACKASAAAGSKETTSLVAISSLSES